MAQRSYRQTGKTTYSSDKKRPAKRPGKRVSASGNVYYERRKNRSDRSKKKRL